MDANLHQKVRELFKSHNINDALFDLEEFAYELNKLKNKASKEDIETLEYLAKRARQAQDLAWIMFDN